MYLKYIFVVACLVAINTPLASAKFHSPKGRQNFTQLAAKIGCSAEEHFVVTKDGYVLPLFHIPGDSNYPVYVQHGVVDSADGFLVREKRSLIAGLVERGYDVWVGNNRGNIYSRKHLTLDPDNDKEFWDFSFHEMGTLDLPAIIDYILEKTGQEQLAAIGHSEGTTVFFTLGAYLPEYKDKIKVMIALAPISYLMHMRGVASVAASFQDALNAIWISLGYEELFANFELGTAMFREICMNPMFYALCNIVGFSSAYGFDPDQYEPEFYPIALNYIPSGTSRKNIKHLAQSTLSKSFTQYNYGPEKNIEVYGTESPPAYDLTQNNIPIYLIASKNDYLSGMEDVYLLKSQLPNVLGLEVLEKTNHVDYVMGRDAPERIYSRVYRALDKYYLN